MSTDRTTRLYFWTGIALLLAAAVLLLGHAMGRGLNHDEHQFLGPAALVSRDHLVPYRDFPIFHLPNLTYLYAALDHLPGDLILKAKLLNTGATIGLLGLFLLIAWRAEGISPAMRLNVFGLATGLLLCDPLFLYSTGKTWNHELPALLLAGAVFLHLESFRKNPLLCAGLSGALVGLATGTRLTHLTTAGAFVMHFLIAPGDRRERLRRATVWLVGLTVALAPSWYFLGTSREAFLFDNFQFPRLRLLDTENTRIQKTANLVRKLRFLCKEVISRSWPLLGAYLFALILPRLKSSASRQSLLSRFIGLALLFCLAGCFAPTRYQYQHYYALAVLLALGTLYHATEIPLPRQRAFLAGATLLLACSAIGVSGRGPDPTDGKVAGWRGYATAGVLFHPEQWQSTRLKRQHEGITRLLTPHSQILTLGPTAVIQAGYNIYPEFGVGVFAWRSAPLVAPARRPLLHFIAPEDLEHIFTGALPPAILTGVEAEEQEKPIIDFAENHSYRGTPLGHGETLWLRLSP